MGEDGQVEAPVFFRVSIADCLSPTISRPTRHSLRHGPIFAAKRIIVRRIGMLLQERCGQNAESVSSGVGIIS
jgi:hypothetical protein